MLQTLDVDVPDNRHAVAHGGLRTSGCVARYNYIREGGFTQGVAPYWNQHFDVHGRGSRGYGGDAGEYFEIAYNTIRSEQTYSLLSFKETRPDFGAGRPSTTVSETARQFLSPIG